MEELDLEIEEVKEDNVKDGLKLPINFLTFGEVLNDDVKVYISQNVYKELEKYALVDTNNERGTILIGDYLEDMGKTFVVISDYIEAKYTDASASTLTFTHETWDYVNKEKDDKYADKKIVGWQHTHPSYGIFLSNYDMFIQENFFNCPFQVAYVIDPIQKIRGFFQWKNGEVQKLNGFYIYDDVGKKIILDNNEENINKNRKERNINPLLFILIAIVLLLGILVFNLNNKYNKQLTLSNQMSEIVASQDKEIEGLNNEIKELKDSIGTSQEKEDESKVGFVKHVVEKGDTLIKICKKYGIDYQKNKLLIVGTNGLENPSKLVIGQIILLPIIE